MAVLPLGKSSRWAAEPVWRFSRRRNPSTPAGIQTPDCPACSLVTLPTEICSLSGYAEFSWRQSELRVSVQPSLWHFAVLLGKFEIVATARVAAGVCVNQPRTCCRHSEHPSQIRCLDADRLRAAVGHQTSTRAHDPHVLTVRYAEQVQGLDQGQTVRHLQGQELCNKMSPSWCDAVSRSTM